MINLVNKTMLNNIIKFYELSKANDTPQANSIVSVNYFNDANCSIRYTLKTWAQNKKHIFELFGNKLKIEVPLKNITLPAQMASGCLNNFIDNHRTKFNPLIRALLNQLEPEEIVSNTLLKDVSIMGVNLKSGWKITKCFRSLEISEENTNRQQDLYSRFIQTLKTNGTLVLSIDPIDYITMSCSQSNWASCHHPNRDYGTGSMFYMSDKSTIITYVKSKDCNFSVKDEDQITEISFPNKIWRQLVVLSPQLQYGIQMRQYPNEHKIINDKVTDLLKELLSTTTSKEMQSIVETVENNEVLYELASSNWDVSNRFYNDIQYESFDRATIIMSKDLNDICDLSNEANTNKDRIMVGVEEVYCACGCGMMIRNGNFFTCEHEEGDYDD